MDIEVIYVKLLEEGIDVWRPVKARRLSESIFEIIDDNDYNTEDEKWEFLPGMKVVCTSQQKNIGSVNVAICVVS